MKHSDRPIFRPREDLLGRANFSLSLARAIDNLTIAKDGFVIAIMGEWGSGKSSVVEMTTRFLVHLEMERTSKIPEKQTLESLELLAESFDKVRDNVSEFDLLNLDLSMANDAARQNLFRDWLGNEDEANRADRYANSIAIALASQRDFVDPIDLLLLELLRLHEPELYSWLRENLDELTE